MAVQTITVRLPDILYHRVEHRAQRMRRSIEEELARSLRDRADDSQRHQTQPA